MRRRITKAFLATAAAGATITTLGFAAAGPAWAATTAPMARASHRTFAPSGGPPIYTPPCANASGFQWESNFFPVHSGGCAGYVGTNRDFRYAQATIRIPARPILQHFLQGLVPASYIGLSSNDSMAIAGVMTCAVYKNLIRHGVFHFPSHKVWKYCFKRRMPPPQAPATSGTASTTGSMPGGDYGKASHKHISLNLHTWLTFGMVVRRPDNVVLAHISALPNAQSGEGINFSIYYNEVGDALHFKIDSTGAGGGIESFFYLGLGAVFDHALALTDFTMSGIQTPPLAPLRDLKLTQFMQGAWTTQNGQRGTFWGPWTTQPVSITFPNGAPPPGNMVTVEPSYLWNDGLGNGWGDAFGVWWRS
jgi:hypothetical protein